MALTSHLLFVFSRPHGFRPLRFLPASALSTDGYTPRRQFTFHLFDRNAVLVFIKLSQPLPNGRNELQLLRNLTERHIVRQTPQQVQDNLFVRQKCFVVIGCVSYHNGSLYCRFSFFKRSGGPVFMLIAQAYLVLRARSEQLLLSEFGDQLDR